MKSFRYTLVTDGSFDRCLLYHIDWLLADLGLAGIDGTWADLRGMGRATTTLFERVVMAAESFPADLIIVHRDAESQSASARRAEIRLAARSLATPCVCLVPVRMTEAWLLGDEAAIREAAGDPRGRQPVPLPGRHRWEAGNSKLELHRALQAASGLQGRRLARFDAASAAHRVAERTESFAHLRGLASFDDFESELRATLSLLSRPS